MSKVLDQITKCEAALQAIERQLSRLRREFKQSTNYVVELGETEAMLFEHVINKYKGHTLKANDLSLYLTLFKKQIKITEGYLRALAKKHRGVFKVVKTSEYHVLSPKGFVPSIHPDNKRITCIKIM